MTEEEKRRLLNLENAVCILFAHAMQLDNYRLPDAAMSLFEHAKELGGLADNQIKGLEKKELH